MLLPRHRRRGRPRLFIGLAAITLILLLILLILKWVTIVDWIKVRMLLLSRRDALWQHL